MNAKKRRALALTLVSLFALTSCSGGAQTPAGDARITLPEPPAEEDRQIIGDAGGARTQEVTLYYAGESSLELTSVTRPISVKQDESLLENALRELLRTMSGAGAARAVPTDNPLIDVEFGCGVATVNLTIETGARQSDSDGLMLSAAIANTLLGLDGVEAVNVLTGSRSDAICALPLGSFDRQNENISALYAQLQSEESRALSDKSAPIRRNVILYFPSADGAYLLPEPRSLDFVGSNCAAVIIDALKEGPLRRECCFSAIPGSEELLIGAPALQITPAGERVIELNFSQMLTNYLAFAGVEPWQLYGSAVLSLCSFVPELDAVRICVEGEAVTECAQGDALLRFDDGLMRRADYSASIGGSSPLYFENADGNLVRREWPMSRSAAASARSILAAMVRAGSPAGLRSVFPEGILPEDILGVTIEDRVALVNLSGNFYAACQMLDAREERNLVYAMINALAELPQIGAVRFLVEGMSLDTLAHGVYLKTPLLPDPGLVQIPAPAAGSEASPEA